MERIKTLTAETRIHPWDRIPIVLKAISGFNSCLTVSVTSAIFIWGIHQSVTTGVGTWPGIATALLMMIGPIIIAWNFVNAKSIITTILTQDPDGAEGDTIPKQVVVPSATPIITESDIAVEREIVGPTTVILRAIAGAFSTHIICFCSLLFTWTIHDAMISGKHLPSNTELFMVVVGPIVTSWNFVRASATLSTVMQGTSAISKWRNKLSGWIATK
ncbi:hypothetical protein OBP_138 [Pseudomonas phage OBP]|uniref:hypothetical protein n=1 Tax=Pseudomonas phage OBP TaxID=1124849 RepID=UPI000240D55F|nr:hypothetical protein OBP_138 [Pseudomonas phage OBP]AEV89575.1 hypothetical protein OBP_138 [Pseudomonas phage OBP]